MNPSSAPKQGAKENVQGDHKYRSTGCCNGPGVFLPKGDENIEKGGQGQA